jgi:1,4-dihydroxy-6-naphthoate synthase
MIIQNTHRRTPAQTHITIAHSPDADDAFMFYGLVEGKVGSPGIKYTHVLRDIETLNHWAREGRYAVTALSVHAYAYVADRYALMSCGASMGEADYGPMVVARTPLTREALRQTVIAIPGKLTSASLHLQLALGGVETIEMPFDAILPAVTHGDVDAGLLIHEGQLTFADEGLHNVFALYTWWQEQMHLPLPLGVNGIRRDLPAPLQQHITHDIRDSIIYSLEHRSEALAYAKQFAPAMDEALVDQFVGMYVNDRTRDMRDEERQAVEGLLTMAHAKQLIAHCPPFDWVEGVI